MITVYYQILEFILRLGPPDANQKGPVVTGQKGLFLKSPLNCPISKSPERGFLDFFFSKNPHWPPIE